MLKLLRFALSTTWLRDGRTRTSRRGAGTVRLRRAVAQLTLCLLLTYGRSVAAQAEAPAFRVKDINAQPIGISSDPRSFVTIGTTAFCIATTADGNEIWKSDGTEAGTAPLRIGFARIGPLAAVGDTLFFVADHSGSTPQLWKSDGAPVHGRERQAPLRHGRMERRV